MKEIPNEQRGVITLLLEEKFSEIKKDYEEYVKIEKTWKEKITNFEQLCHDIIPCDGNKKLDLYFSYNNNSIQVTITFVKKSVLESLL